MKVSWREALNKGDGGYGYSYKWRPYKVRGSDERSRGSSREEVLWLRAGARYCSVASSLLEAPGIRVQAAPLY